MRKLIHTSAAILALSLATVASHAQSADQTQGPPPHRGQFQHRGPNPEFEAKMLSHHLQLSPEQEAQITPILAEQHEQMKALMPPRRSPDAARPADGAPRPDFKSNHEQMKAIMDSTKEKLEAVMTPEQKEKFEKMHEHGFRGPGGPRGDHGPRPTTAAPPA